MLLLLLQVQVSEFQDHKVSLYLGMVYCADNDVATNVSFFFFFLYLAYINDITMGDIVVNNI